MSARNPQERRLDRRIPLGCPALLRPRVGAVTRADLPARRVLHAGIGSGLRTDTCRSPLDRCSTGDATGLPRAPPAKCPDCPPASAQDRTALHCFPCSMPCARGTPAVLNQLCRPESPGLWRAADAGGPLSEARPRCPGQ